tara:strand:- start:10587 stop:12752 length:2166 start_codon:yes stop_codon:yes gene_type:complete
MEIEAIKECRVCGSNDLEDLFSLGNLCISTFVKNKGDNIGKAPLDLIWCNKCTLVQLKHTAPQELLYSGHYWYKSGLNKVIINDLEEITKVGSEMVGLKDGDVVLDIGANDGTLLSFYPEKIVKVGCEPATNLVEDMKKKANLAITDFWSYDAYKEKVGDRKAKIVTAIGMFYDMDDPNQFIGDAAKILDDDGVFIAQLMTSKPMLDKNDVGNICHEHIEYYSYLSLKELFERNGLEIFKVEENSINGGSYRLFARHLKSGSIDYSENLTKEDYMQFYERIERNKRECLELVNSILAEGKKIYGYAASTKGNTILQYYGLTDKEVKGIAEISEEKFGMYSVGSEIEIIKEDEAKKDADYFLVLPFAFKDAFIKREQKWLKEGGKFIFSTPKVEVSGFESSEEKKKRALIMGITGQDGSYLAEILLEKGYEVHGMYRRSATGNTKNIKHILDKIKLYKGDLADATSLYRIISEVKPDEIYNEADQDHVAWSYEIPAYSYDITASAVGRMLEIVKQIDPKIKVFQPLSSTMFGDASEIPQKETTTFAPQSPYACAKLMAYFLAKYYREVHGMFVATAIFYNHDSPRRGEEYLLHKICASAVRISKGTQDKLMIGALDLPVDIGYAKEYMETAWKIMQADEPEDFIVSTGESSLIRDLIDEAFKQVGVDPKGKVEIDPNFARPGKQIELVGDITKAKEKLGFEIKTTTKDLIKILIDDQMKRVD